MTPSVNKTFWFSDVSDAAAYQNAAQSMVVLMGSIHGAKPFPASAQRVMELASKPDYDVSEVVRAVQSDPAFSARLLGIVNSAAFSLGVPCKSVAQAVSLLGGGGLRETAATAIVADFFRDKSKLGQAVLDHSTGVAILARFMAARFRLSPEDMFTAALLHDLGKIMMLQYGDRGYAALVEKSQGHPDTLHLEERNRFGFDHAVLGGHMFNVWKIPEPFPRLIAWHHQGERAMAGDDKTIGRMIAMLRIADMLAYLLEKQAEVSSDEVGALFQTPEARFLELSQELLLPRWDTLKSLYARRGEILAGPSEGGEAEELPRAISVRPVADRPSLPVCAFCGDIADGKSCPRCSRSLCKEHGATAVKRCEPCERDYQRIVRMTQNATAERWYLGIALSGLVGTTLVTVLGMLMAIPLTAACFGLGAGLWWHAKSRKSDSRARFLRERFDGSS